MDDTSADIANKLREMFQKKTPFERLNMGFSMFETSKHLVAKSILENNSIYSCAELRQQLFIQFYGNDFDPIIRQRILDHLGSNPSHQNKRYYNFEHIPEIEKKQKWWKLLEPIVRARLTRDQPENSKLLKVLGNLHGIRTWKDVKNSIEIAIMNVQNGEEILSRTSEVIKSPDPDGIIDHMFGELRTVPYLHLKGFKNICYTTLNGFDFKAELNGKIVHIGSTYVQGPDFKTPEYLFNNYEPPSSIFKIKPDKLVTLFKTFYAKKLKQLLRHKVKSDNAFIFMITDIEETYEPWLEHAQRQHPLGKLVSECEFPTVIFGCGSIYPNAPKNPAI